MRILAPAREGVGVGPVKVRLHGGNTGGVASRNAGGKPPTRSFRCGRELVADPVARLDEGVPARPPVHLASQAPDEDVDRPIPMGLASSPDPL